MATLNYSLREGLEFGTDEMGMANLKMILDYAADSFTEALLQVAQGYKNDEVTTNRVSIGTLCEYVFHQLREDDTDAAQMWNKSWFQLVSDGKFVTHWLQNWKGIIFVDAEQSENAQGFDEVVIYMDLIALDINLKANA